jgi:hypothetical protein
MVWVFLFLDKKMKKVNKKKRPFMGLLAFGFIAVACGFVVWTCTTRTNHKKRSVAVREETTPQGSVTVNISGLRPEFK